MIKPRFYPTDDLPLWIEVDLDMLGVRKPKNPTSSSKPADHESNNVPWKPTKPDEQPPF